MATTIKKAYADTPHGQIHYRFTTAPQTNPHPIIFLHMSASSSDIFLSLMGTYASLGYACFAPDMPGFGSSFDPVSDPPDIAWYIDLYMAIFSPHPAFSRGNGGCHLYGHHSGAVIAVEWATLHPQFIKSITLHGPVLMEKEKREEMRSKVTVPFNKPVSDGSHLTKVWEYLQAHGGLRADGEEGLEILQMEALNHIRAWRGRIQIYNCVWDHDGPKLFRQVKCPVLALCARDDVLWGSFGAVRELRPDDELVQVAEVRGSNFGPATAPESMVEVFTPFLERVEKKNW
jgi:pimeloyl-ACP methyl ester carboxylesterase